MKQIFSWTIGSFFRTIGRTLALLGMGALLYFILSRLGFGITDLFFDEVKATDFTSGYTDAYYSNSGRTNILTTHGAPTADYYGYEYSYNDGVTRYILSYYNNFYFKTNITTSNQTNVMYIPVYMSSLSGTQIEYSLSTYVHDTRDNKYYSCERISYAGSSEVYSIIKCPFRKGAVIDKIETYAEFRNASGLSQASYYLNRFYTLEYEDNVQAIIDNQNQNNQNIINNQNNQTQQIIQQQQNATQQIMDNNSTATDQKADSFFNNSAFEDTGGLSSIITAPLSMINSMLNNSYSMPCATWKGAQICLPGGDMLWSRPGASDLKNVLNVFYGGVVCYYAIRKLFLMIERMKDPTSDNIEVTDL